MTVVNTLKTTQNTYTYDQLQQMMATGAIDQSTVQNVSVFSQSADPSACTDGKDDGKIGFFSAVGSAIKGAAKGLVNGVKGMFTDENGKFSLGKTLKTVAIGAACMIPGVGPFISAGLCAYGAVKGVTGIAKGVSAAANAKTDAEAKAAFESIGSNTLTTGLSIVGLKGSVSQIAKNAGFTATGSLRGDLKNLASGEGTGVVGTAKNIAGNLKNSVNMNQNYYGAAWKEATGGKSAKDISLADAYKGTKAVVKKGADGTWNNIKGVYDGAKSKTDEVAEAAKKQGETVKQKVTGKAGKTPKAAKAPKVKIGQRIKGAKAQVVNGAIKTNTFLTNHPGVTGVLAMQTADASEDMLNTIPYMSTTYGTVTTQTGKYFELEDYKLPTM